MTDLPATETRSALACLAQAQLVEAVPDSSGRWRLSAAARTLAESESAVLTGEERDDAWDRLLDYYLMTAEAAEVRLRGLAPIPVPQPFADRAGALAWLDSERAALVAAVKTAAETGRDEAAKCLPLLLSHYFDFRALFDDLAATTTAGLAAARRIGDRAGEGDALTNLGVARYNQRRYGEARIAHQEAMAIFQETGDRPGEGEALNNLGLALHGLGHDDEALTTFDDAINVFRETGDVHGEGEALNNLGLALCARGQFAESVSAHRGAVKIFRETGDLHSVAVGLSNLGNVGRASGQYRQAAIAYRRAAAIFGRTGDQLRKLEARKNLKATQAAL